jgi:hypothetical protein
MARFVSFLLLVVLVIAVVGWYRGWFYAQSDSDRHATDITVTVDKQKIREDEQSADQAAHNLAQEVKNKVDSPTTVPATEPAQ